MRRPLRLTLGLLLGHLLGLLLGWIGFLVLSGGFILHLPIGKLELASVDPFAAIFLLLFWVASFVDRSGWERFQARLDQAAWRLQEFQSPSRVAGILVGTVFFGIFLAHSLRHLSFNTHFYDMGFVNQSLFFPYSDGSWLQSDLSPKRSYLVDHFSPTLLLLSPLTSWLRSNFLIFGLQALLLALGTYVLIRSGPLKKKPAIWAVAALILLSNRSLRNGALWDMREDVLAFVFLCGVILALCTRRLLLYALFLAGFVLSKEHLGIVAMGLAAPILFSQDLPYSTKERRWIAAGTITALLVWSSAVFWVLTPTLQRGIAEASNIALRFPEFGSTPKEIILRLLTEPSAWWLLLSTKVLKFEAIKYMVLILAPYLYFGRKGWPWMIAASLGIAMNVVSGSSLQRSLNFHYDLGLLPFLMVGALSGMGAASKEGKLAPRALLLGAFLALTFSGRWPGFAITQNIPTSAQVQDHLFLERMECPSVLAANPRNLARFIRCEEIRFLVMQGECASPEEAFRQFQAQDSDTSRIPGQSVLNAKSFILDRRLSCERDLETAFLARGGRLEAESPTGSLARIEFEYTR